jgi:hypothetical protein
MLTDGTFTEYKIKLKYFYAKPPTSLISKKRAIEEPAPSHAFREARKDHVSKSAWRHVNNIAEHSYQLKNQAFKRKTNKF